MEAAFTPTALAFTVDPIAWYLIYGHIGLLNQLNNPPPGPGSDPASTATIGPAPTQPPPLKPGCSSGAIGPAVKAAVSDFFGPPGSDPWGDVGDAVRDKNNQRAAVGALYLTADALKLAVPIAEVGAKVIPVVGWAILGYQVYSAGSAAWEAYKQSVDQCYGGG